MLGIATAVISFAVACRKLLHSKRDTVDCDRNRVEECQDRAEQQQSNNSAVIGGIENALGIIQKIREEQKISKDCSGHN